MFESNAHENPPGSPLVFAFDQRSAADEAVSELRAASFNSDQLGLLARGDVVEWTEAGADLLWGPGVSAGRIKPLGLLIASGILGALLASVVTSAERDPLLSGLLTMSLSAEEAKRAMGAIQSGHLLLYLRAGARHAAALQILRGYPTFALNAPD
jgi:hypothetical protein